MGISPVFIYVSLFLPLGMQALTCCFVYFCDLDRDGAVDDKVEWEPHVTLFDDHPAVLKVF